MLKGKNIIIFDYDGTLVDTMSIFADVASRLIFEHYGLNKGAARQRYLETSGLPFCKQIEIIFPGHNLNREVSSIYETEKVKAAADRAMDRETLEALKVLKDRGYGLAVSSNNSQYNISQFIENNRMGELFRLALGFKDDFGKGREHFNFIKSELGLDGREMIFIGDSINDARLAKENEIDFVGKIGTFTKNDFAKFDKYIFCINKISDLIYG